MNVFFDTEFTGLVPNSTLISIGMVTDSGHKFYAEFTDYNRNLCDDWIKENVIDHLLINWDTKFSFNTSKVDITNMSNVHVANLVSKLPKDTRFVVGPSDYVVEKLSQWLYSISNENQNRIQLISDVCHYDMTLLCNLFGGAFNLPPAINPVCYDICQDIWTFLEDDYKLLSDRMYHSFDVSREELVNSINYDDEDNKPKGIKHNSLYDAEVIRYLYKSLIGD